MKKIRSCIINGKRWRIVWSSPGGDFGECDWDKHTITINPSCDPTSMCDVLIHELAHAHFPCMSEAAIDSFATSASDTLFKAGLINEDALDAR